MLPEAAGQLHIFQRPGGTVDGLAARNHQRGGKGIADAVEGAAIIVHAAEKREIPL